MPDTHPKVARIKEALSRAAAFSLTGPVALVNFALAVFGAGMAVYTFGYQEAKRTEVSAAIWKAEDVIAELASGLDIQVLVGGQPVREAQTKLRVSWVRIWNSGDFTVRSTDFDSRAPVGFALNGLPIAIDVPYASTSYLKDNIQPKIVDGRIAIQPVTLEPDESVMVRVVYARPAADADEIEPFGKLSGTGGVEKRIAVRHPAGYLEGYFTPKQLSLRRWGAALAIVIPVGLAIWMWWPGRRRSKDV